jgi:polyisoprenyl-teichoic acid--peptidoglycan teichoic acid transferase
MPAGEKPYRVYRGGRVKGKVPTLPRPERARRDANGRGPAPTTPAPGGPKRRRPGWGKLVALALGTLLLLFLVWGVASFLAVRSGVSAANKRLGPRAAAALAPQDGLLTSKPTTILLLGTDHSDRADRATARRSDSIMLVRTDPKHGRVYQLSLPRDLRVEVPGVGTTKINAAFQVGGPALAARTIRQFTGIPINHVATVDFGTFAELVDALGGIEVNVPKRILSNPFDCPYDAEKCQTWSGWRFGKGKQHLDGRRALVYSRIRENQLDPAENDITRGERQQQVLDAITDKLTSVGTLARLPFIGDDLLRPLATDLTTGQFIQLGWLRFRAGKTVHCRLGGTPSTIGGEAFIVPTEENRNVIAMFRGVSAPQPPPPGSGTFGPGCTVR